ncbi:phage tail protein [Pseudomonas sp. SLFW]|uniref:phage tail protein n=1 Tax=Pseudomonas sp. SLFW TaxID=2683259 RepID=UPI0014123772|nr:phage tail protein [Pseudomonas sp. SLFW]NBB11824.1 phage tail protein [Pseudomonas sp. SLFW]
MAKSIALPNGATFDLATGFAASKIISAISNASPAVATAAANGLADGAIILVDSGWGKLNGRAVRVTAAGTDAFSLENINTTNTDFFTAGGGAGSFQAVSGWVGITKVTGTQFSGGEQQFTTVGYLEDDDDHQYPTNRSPMSIAITVEDQPTAAYVPVAENYTNNKTQSVLRLNLPSGDKILYPGYCTITDTPTLSRNELMTRTVNFALSSRPVRYLKAA